ncbi:MAG: hypothetical protein K1X89_19450 [Myxococcaceae bacterium]|nr:hypothetical protein [Myxococcaceae bacterium]
MNSTTHSRNRRWIWKALVVSAAAMSLYAGCLSLTPDGSLALIAKIEGQGTITSSPAGLFCISGRADVNCQASFDATKLPLKLTATPAKGWVFKSWARTGTPEAADQRTARTITLSKTFENAKETWTATFVEGPPEPEPEMMMPEMDAGMEEMDAGMEEMDAGMDPDAGMGDPDAGDGGA